MSETVNEGLSAVTSVPGGRNAWTDDPELGNFVEYHETQRREWSPDAWHLELGVWLEGELAGVQALESTGFAETRTVGTGSWLGTPF